MVLRQTFQTVKSSNAPEPNAEILRNGLQGLAMKNLIFEVTV